MSRSIPISPKHGVNPSLLTCFWCQKNNTGIALLGRLKNDEEAPRQVLDMTYEPCEDCKKQFEKGYTLFKVIEKPLFNGHQPIQSTPHGDLYPTGATITITNPDVVRKLFTPPELAEEVLEKKKAYIDQEAFDNLIAAIESANKEN